ncbi:hypothetical protein DOK67_0002380 [Enterococcus sp. DIV0212c]
MAKEILALQEATTEVATWEDEVFASGISCLTCVC